MVKGTYNAVRDIAPGLSFALPSPNRTGLVLIIPILNRNPHFSGRLTMKFSRAAFFVAASVSQVQGSPRADNPPYFVLVGDSTVAVNGGWGDGFLPTLQSSAAGVNSGKSGATTVSYRAAGLWNEVINTVKTHSNNYRPIVTIQFGHNDQKAEAGISLDQFRTNLQNMANDVTLAGGIPVGYFCCVCSKPTHSPISTNAGVVDPHHVPDSPQLQRRQVQPRP